MATAGQRRPVPPKLSFTASPIASAAVHALSALFFWGSHLSGQIQPRSVDIYAHFVGDWVGFDDTNLGGSKKHIPVEIVITEAKGKDEVRMQYTYSHRGQRDYTTITKFMALNVKSSEMRIRLAGGTEINEIYKASGLGEFAQTGSGKFIATGRAPGPVGGPGLFALELEENMMTYEWLRGNKSHGYDSVSVFKMQRAGFASAKP